MKASGYFEYVYNDLFSEIPGITYRPMFGGVSFYMDGKIFGMIAGMADEEKLFFKVGEGNLADYQGKGMEPFTYTAKNGKSIAMKYYQVPEEVMEDREQLKVWVDKAVEEAKRPKG